MLSIFMMLLQGNLLGFRVWWVSKCFCDCNMGAHAGREGKNALACAACGCHRNFHRRVQLAWDRHDQGGKDDHEDMEQQQLHEKEGAGENEHVTSICKIERVAHELMAAASRTIHLLSQELPCLSHRHQNHHAAGRVEDLFIREHNVMAKISVENLDHIAKVCDDSIFIIF
jgi:hypothetical protein